MPLTCLEGFLMLYPIKKESGSESPAGPRCSQFRDFFSATRPDKNSEKFRDFWAVSSKKKTGKKIGKMGITLARRRVERMLPLKISRRLKVREA